MTVDTACTGKGSQRVSSARTAARPVGSVRTAPTGGRFPASGGVPDSGRIGRTKRNDIACIDRKLCRIQN